ncbi:hypothetical protein TWF679_002771 [Orbilia oligospora]|uniref:Uncharacterized protein n=1 Tax=Orbilia oligospora TaxID=2813651 RepID=A0A8H8USX1_ORBOL|nr:hypothetical protein TWF679_002771 [Orbilia oligospora]
MKANAASQNLEKHNMAASLNQSTTPSSAYVDTGNNPALVACSPNFPGNLWCFESNEFTPRWQMTHRRPGFPVLKKTFRKYLPFFDIGRRVMLRGTSASPKL